MKESTIGQEVIVRDTKHEGSVIVAGRYIDKNGRVRLLTGEYSGEVLLRGDYKLMEKLECDENPFALLGMIWAMD